MTLGVLVINNEFLFIHMLLLSSLILINNGGIFKDLIPNSFISIILLVSNDNSNKTCDGVPNDLKYPHCDNNKSILSVVDVDI
jgi:hypothetical protein